MLRQCILFFIPVLFSACIKKQIPIPDARDKVVGTYYGYTSTSMWNGITFTSTPWSAITFQIDKSSKKDSLVYFSYGSTAYEYKYTPDTFISTSNNYHPPFLSRSANDTLRFRHNPALGPITVYGKGKKH